jgi:hypothetical protein
MSKRRTEIKGRLVWVALLFALPAASTERPVPEWLQGRASDTYPGPPIETSSTIDAQCQRPRNVPEFLENLKVVWDKKLLTQPAFFRNKSLMCFFGGVSTTWKRELGYGPDTYRRSVTMTLDENIFPHAAIQALTVVGKEAAVPGLPAHVHYMGVLSLDVEAASSLTLKEVQSAFGPNFHKRSTIYFTGDGLPKSPSGKVFVFYLYPGDDPEKYGVAELPQIQFLLKQGNVAPHQVNSEDPQDSDVIKSIRVIERANRK